jgi:hypothetical protein
MTDFLISTAGGVEMRPGDDPRGFVGVLHFFDDLTPLTRGYIEGALISFNHQTKTPADKTDGWGFADLSPQTLGRMIADCERFAPDPRSILRQYPATGRGFWSSRQAGTRPHFPPLTMGLGRDGKIHMAATVHAIPPVALCVIWGETLALLRWNLSAYLADHEAPDDIEQDGPDIARAIASIDAAAAERGAGPWNEAACAWVPAVDGRGFGPSADVLRNSIPVRAWTVQAFEREG